LKILINLGNYASKCLLVSPREAKRKGISPVIATVILLAITLIAAVSMGGFVFGLIGSFSSVGAVTTTQTFISAADANGATGLASATCSASASGDFLSFTNLGTASVSIEAAAVSIGGHSFSTQTRGSCSVPQGATVYVNLAFTGTNGITASDGESFAGSVATSNGGVVYYIGSLS